MNESEVQRAISEKDNPDITIVRHNPERTTLKRLAMTFGILNALDVNINGAFDQVKAEEFDKRE